MTFIDENQAAALIETHRIYKIEQTESTRITFLLGNGHRLTLILGRDYDREWKLDDAGLPPRADPDFYRRVYEAEDKGDTQ